MPSRRQVVLSLAALPLASAVRAGIAPVHATEGLAMNGYDPVAYFTEGAPRQGDSSISLSWNGAEWHFASAEHRQMFEAAPELYAPQYGGYCAYAVSKGYSASGDPEAWRIWEGRLFLNNNKVVRALWARDIPGNVARADENWPGLTAD